MFPNGGLGGLMIWFAVGPCIWYYRQLKMAQYLLELIELPRAEVAKWVGWCVVCILCGPSIRVLS